MGLSIRARSFHHFSFILNTEKGDQNQIFELTVTPKPRSPHCCGDIERGYIMTRREVFANANRLGMEANCHFDCIHWDEARGRCKERTINCTYCEMYKECEYCRNEPDRSTFVCIFDRNR